MCVDLAAAVAESRARCGLPPKITDPTALRGLAALFLAVDVARPRGKRAAMRREAA